MLGVLFGRNSSEDWIKWRFGGVGSPQGPVFSRLGKSEIFPVETEGTGSSPKVIWGLYIETYASDQGNCARQYKLCVEVVGTVS